MPKKIVVDILANAFDGNKSADRSKRSDRQLRLRFGLWFIVMAAGLVGGKGLMEKVSPGFSLLAETPNNRKPPGLSKAERAKRVKNLSI